MVMIENTHFIVGIYVRVATQHCLQGKVVCYNRFSIHNKSQTAVFFRCCAGGRRAAVNNILFSVRANDEVVYTNHHVLYG